MTTDTLPDLRDPEAALQFIFDNAPQYAKAKAHRRGLEEFRKSKKALLMGDCTEKAVNAREQYAYAHPEYVELLRGLTAAIEAEETLEWRLTAAELSVEVWRTMSANNRNMDRAAR